MNMSIETQLKEMRLKLVRKERELEILLDMDRIRDSSRDQSSLLADITGYLVDRFGARAGVFYLIDSDARSLALDNSVCRGQSEGSFKPVERLPANNFIAALASRKIAAFGPGSMPGCVTAVSESISAMACVIMAVSIHGVTLGYFLIVRTEGTFSEEEIALLTLAENQIDSAVIQMKKSQEIKLRNLELEAIRRIDAIRDRCLPFEEMIDCALKEIASTVTGETSFLMLYDVKRDLLELKGVSNRDYDFSKHFKEVEAISKRSMKKQEPTIESLESGSGRSVMCKPLILDRKIIGVLGVLNKSGRSIFSRSDRALFSGIASQIDTAIFEGIEKARLKQVLGRSVDAKVLGKLLEDSRVDFLKGEREVITVLYADLRGSTRLSEKTDPEVLVGFINDYLGSMADVILRNGGTLDKFVGDEVMALFGAPVRNDDHALIAIKVGLEMVEEQKLVLGRWKDKIPFPAPVGVGIATGEMIAGEMGCERRAEYTVIGRAANLGSRICNQAEAEQVLISSSTYELTKDRITAVPISGMKFKGIDEEVTIYKVTGVK